MTIIQLNRKKSDDVVRSSRLFRFPNADNFIAVWTCRILFAAVILGAWQALTSLHLIDPLFLASPIAVAKFLVGYTLSGNIWRHGIVTLEETLLGFLSGSVLGIILGLVLGWSRFLEKVLTPFLTIFNSLPRVALAPMFILWFGIGDLSKVVLAFSLVFFIVVINTEAGVRSVDPDLTMMAKVMGATDRQRFIKVILPGAIPSIFAGLRIGAIYSLLGVVVGEMIAAKWGLGQQMMEYSYNYKPDGVFGVLFVLAAIALCLNIIMVRTERYLTRWKGTDSAG
jgi:ABC-type nitrate/sulfonate/bicarbonate transport system permease component